MTAWRVLLWVAVALGAVVTTIAVDLARGLGSRELLLVVGVVVAAGAGWLHRFALSRVVAAACLLAVGIAGLFVRPAPTLDALHAGLGGMMQQVVAGALLPTVALLLVVDVRQHWTDRAGIRPGKKVGT